MAGDKYFCCNGCKFAYELLEASDLCTYYDLDSSRGNTVKESGSSLKYQFLDDARIQQQLIRFSEGTRQRTSFFVPSMHCSSCIWLLENMYKIHPGVLSAKVNFLRKEVSVSFDSGQITLREVVELMDRIGYAPQINLDTVQEKVNRKTDRDLYIKIGVAGFCFANIMLLSFPEYLSMGEDLGSNFQNFFGILNVILSLPVFFYSSMEYFVSAWKGLRERYINIDVPISLGIITLFVRSLYEVAFSVGSGYFDSLTGLVFLLLVGKIFQKKTYDTLSFERDYRSYFPISVTRKKDGDELPIALEALTIGDRIVVRNQELIPADAVLINGPAMIDYSFVTGESEPVAKVSGDLIYAGGKQVGGAIEVDVVKEVSQSYLTQLWNNDIFKEGHQNQISSLANSISKYFTFIVLAIATVSAFYWWQFDSVIALNAFTAVLIVACPCALALSTPFTLGNTLRIFGRNKFYLKNTAVVELLAKITDIVFDKTGTLTRAHEAEIEFVPAVEDAGLESDHESLIASLARQSTHPLSRRIYQKFASVEPAKLDYYHEAPGEGIEGQAGKIKIRIGSTQFISGAKYSPDSQTASHAHVSIDDHYLGYFRFVNVYRPGLAATVNRLKNKFTLALLSGDNESEKQRLKPLFGETAELRFNQSPFEKLNYIRGLQEQGGKVLMIGDGLNDAGALKQSNVGISISEDVNTFSPACDAILEANHFEMLGSFVEFSRFSLRVIIASFVISFMYNLVGMYFAVQGTLSPLIAAILMPISSITVIVFATGMTSLYARKHHLI
jgi:Cu+-exporting ATPase